MCQITDFASIKKIELHTKKSSVLQFRSFQKKSFYLHNSFENLSNPIVNRITLTQLKSVTPHSGIKEIKKLTAKSAPFP